MNRPERIPKMAEKVLSDLSRAPEGLDDIQSDLRRNICQASSASSRPETVKPNVNGAPETGWVSVSEMKGMKWSQPSETHNA